MYRLRYIFGYNYFVSQDEEPNADGTKLWIMKLIYLMYCIATAGGRYFTFQYYLVHDESQ